MLLLERSNVANIATAVIGLTATGRATIQELKLNRAGVINLRRVLFTMSEHPPLDSLIQ
jgi:hypothetical protein